MTIISNVVGFKRKCSFGRNRLKYASLEDSQLAEDFGISRCTSEIPGECCREDEMCKCDGEVLEIFPPQCSIEPTYCEPKGKLISYKRMCKMLCFSNILYPYHAKLN